MTFDLQVCSMHVKPKSAKKREFLFSARKRQNTDFFMFIEIRIKSLVQLAVSMLLETPHLSGKPSNGQFMG